MKFFAFVAILVTFSTVESEIPPGTPPDIVAALSRLVDANTHWTMKCLRASQEREPEESHITELPALLMTLAQSAIYSDIDFRNKLLNFIGLNSVYEVEQCFPIALGSLRDLRNKGITSKLDLSVFADKRFPFCDNYTESYNQIFNGVTKNINLNNAIEGADIINNWVKRQLWPHGEDLITPKQVCDPNGLNYISTSEFVVNWSPESCPRIGEMDFCEGDNKISRVPALYLNIQVQTAQIDSIRAKVVKIHLNEKWSLVFCIPNNVNGILDLLEALSNPENFKDAINLPTAKNLTIFFPIPKISGKIDFKHCLDEVNLLQELFNPTLSRLEGLYNGRNDYITSILHETYFDLTSSIKNGKPSDICCRPDNNADVNINGEYIYFTMCGFNTPIHAGTYK